jgi:hypothetical protein
MLDYISLVLGAGIGLLCSMGLFFVQQWWNRRNERNNAIKLLRMEISLILEVIDEGIIPAITESLELVETDAICADMSTPKLDTQFYEKSISSISLIKTEKLFKIKHFYFAVNLYQHAIEKALLHKNDKVMLKSWLEKALNWLVEAKRFGEELLSDFGENYVDKTLSAAVVIE